MFKVGTLLDDSKRIHGAKYFLTAQDNSNTVALDGAELIPIDLGGRLITNPTISSNELGKQLLKVAADGDVEELNALLTKGAVFTADWLGTSPLHLAAQNNHLEITEILLRAGISKDATTKVNRTPLHMAAFYGHLQIVDVLVKHGADLDFRDLLGMTPLHWAVQNGHLEVVQYLISNGAQINVENKFNLTPLLIARQIRRTDIEDYINSSLTNSAIAAQNLVIQLTADVENNSESHSFSEDMELENSNHESIIIPIEPAMLTSFEPENAEIEGELSQTVNGDEYFQEEDQAPLETENDQLNNEVNIDTSSFSDSLKLLQEHGITMLQTDENEDGNILNSVMESGHSVVLTDIGKEVLNSVKQSEQQQPLQMDQKIVQVTPEEFLAMANGSLNNTNVFKRLKVLPVKGQVKRIVMKKNKIIPIRQVTSVRTDQSLPTLQTSGRPTRTDMELVMSQLIEARKTIEEFKIKYQKKEQEAERYKLQLKSLMNPT